MGRNPDPGGKTGSEELARVIRERRERLGLSRQELAEAAGIPYPTLAQIETAYRGVSPARLGLLGRVLGLDPKDLYEALATPVDDADVPAVAAIAAERRPAAAAGSWHPNPRFAATPTARTRQRQPPEHSPEPPPEQSPEHSPEQSPEQSSEQSPERVVEQVAALLAGVPAEDRITVLGQIQTRLLEDLLAERERGLRGDG